MHMMSDPQYALGNYPAGFAPLIGVLVEADFDGAAIGQRTLPVLLHIQGAPDVRAVVNFGSMR
jgi:hypothetical protein